MKQKILLLQDVDNYGRAGDIVTVKAGFSRNYLVPQQMAVVADKQTIRMQEKLQKERAIQAEKDCKEAEDLAKTLENLTLKITVKVDAEGHLYGSVSSQDIVELFVKEKIEGIEKKFIQLPKPIKATGVFPISLKLKEGVPATVQLHVEAEGGNLVSSKKKANKSAIAAEKEEQITEYEELSEEAKEE